LPERVLALHNFILVDSSQWSQDIVNNPADMNICLGRDAALDVYAQKCSLYHASLDFRHIVGLPDPRWTSSPFFRRGWSGGPYSEDTWYAEVRRRVTGLENTA
ncbi:MAG: hypothetical protein ACK56I_27750, partial [bacterium]